MGSERKVGNNNGELMMQFFNQSAKVYCSREGSNLIDCFECKNESERKRCGLSSSTWWGCWGKYLNGLYSVILFSSLFLALVGCETVTVTTSSLPSSASGFTDKDSFTKFSDNSSKDGILSKDLSLESRRYYKQRWRVDQLVHGQFNLTSSRDDDVHICKYINLTTVPTTTSEFLFEDDIFMNNHVHFVDVYASSSDTADEKISRGRRAATARRERIWDFGVIPYEIDGNFSGAHKTLFKQAMRHWENSTCVKFVERTDEHPNYIVFTEKACGCCSFVGKRGNGPQAISIGKNCDKFGIVVHELGHAVGFWHEHTRPDRDDHVVIIRENIMTGQEYNFNKLTAEEVNSLGENYDFDSIMHYARNTFSRSTFLDTILPREDPNSRHRPEIGQRIRLSIGDINQANRLYKCPKCGRTLLDPTGWFASPYHPSTYTNQSSSNPSPPSSPPVVDRSVGLALPPPLVLHGEKCEWRIVATHGETIVLNITDFDLPYSDGCKHDYLEIRDGYWHKSPLLGRFCGPNLRFDRAIVSTGSRMVLTYSTTKSVESYRGFQVVYEAVCGGDLFGENGHLESPNFPDEYLASKECIWRITVPEGYQVSLQFHSFEIENHENCVYDFLEIRDGLTQNSTLLGTYCGYYPPAPLTSSSNQLWVRFISDGSVQKAGFSASYQKELDECARGLDDCEHTCKNTIGSYTCGCKFGFELHSNGRECEDACGGIIEEENGTLTSPSFPNLYPSNKHCAWEIIAPPQTRITINFTHFDLEGNNQECDYDSVEVYSKLSQEELKRHGSFCGSRPPSMITSEGNSIRIVFTSDNSVQKTGFALVYFTDKDECATNNGGCAQICRNTVGSYICLCYNGFTLHSNGHDCKEGGCKFDLSTPSVTNEISSPNYPEPYPGKKECIWIISTIQGHRVKLVFDELEVEQHPECTYDAVSIYDGSNSDMSILGKFCGSKVPPPVISSSNQMMMLFKSDGSVHRRGFHAKHYSVCGGLLFATTQEEYIYSHANYGDSTYSDSEDCEWIIEMTDMEGDTDTDDLLVDHEESWQQRQQALGPMDYIIELTFLSFEVEDENDCAFDFVEIFNGDDASLQSKSLGRYCGNRLPPPVRSEENGALLIRFKSDDTVNAKGFAAVYRAISSVEVNNKGPPSIKVPPPVPINPQSPHPSNFSGGITNPGQINGGMINNDSQENATFTNKLSSGTIHRTGRSSESSSLSSSSSGELASVEASPTTQTLTENEEFVAKISESTELLSQEAPPTPSVSSTSTSSESQHQQSPNTQRHVVIRQRKKLPKY